MNLTRMKWGAAIVICAFLLLFEYLRHFVWPALLHQWPLYVFSVSLVFIAILIFNQIVFRMIGSAQRQLSERTRDLNLLIESSGNAIITIDPQGRILSWNPAAEAIYGWPAREAVGTVLPMVPAEGREEAAAIMARLSRGETLRNFETLRMRQDGERIPVMLTASPVKNEAGAIIAVLGISADLRERKRMEDALVRQQRATAVFQERERLARELHDDIGQVLGYVNTQSQAMLTLIERDDIQGAGGLARRLAEVAQEAHANVRNYILGLQTSSALPQGFLPALSTYAERFGRANGLRVETSWPADSDAIALESGVAAQVMRVAQEALTNVQKHAAARTVRLSAVLEPERLVLTIVDDGRGFDPSDVAASHVHHFGQRIMQERMAEIGGRVSVESGLGTGTRVTIETPLRAEG